MRRIVIEEGRNEAIFVDGYEDLKRFQDCEDKEIYPRGKSRKMVKSLWEHDNTSFRGDTNKDFLEKIHHGCWEDGVQKMGVLREQLKKGLKLEAVRRKLQWHKSRGRLNPNRVLNGSVRPWKSAERTAESRRQSLKGGAYTVVINNDAYGGVSDSEFFWIGATASAITEILVKAGRRVEVWTAIKTDWGGGQKDIFYCKVKGFQQPMDFNNLAITAHAGFLRLYGFCAAAARETFDPSSGYGGVGSLDDKDLEAVCKTNTIAISGIWSEKAAVEFVANFMEAQEK